MKTLRSVIRTLRGQRKAAAAFVERYRKEIERIDAGLMALIGKATSSVRPKRKMSAAARRKIAKAQRARWAKVRAKAKPRAKAKQAEKAAAAA